MSDRTTTPNNDAAKHLTRNSLAFVGEGTLFGLGLLFAGTSTILPGFVDHLVGSTLLVGLIVGVTEGAWRLPQLFFANWLSCKPRKKPYLTRVGLLARPTYLIFAIALTFGIWRNPILGVVVFFSLQAAMFTGLAVDSVVWWDVFAKAIPPGGRGRVLGTTTALRGCIAVVAGILIAFLFGDSGPAFPLNYVISFAIAGGFFTLSLVSWTFIVEPEEPVARERAPWLEYLRRVGEVLKQDAGFRRVAIVRLLAGFNGLALGFYVLFSIHELGFPKGMIGLFASAEVVGGILSGLLFGWVTDRFGSHRVIQIATAFGLVSPAVALIFLVATPLLWPPLYALVFVANGVSLNANFIGFANLNIDLAPPGERTLYVGLFNTISGLVVIWPAIGGWVLQQTSYVFLFAVSLAMLVVAHLASWWLPSVHGRAVHRASGMPPLP